MSWLSCRDVEKDKNRNCYRNLPPPIRPNGPYSSDDDRRGGSLSDFSDYQSSDEDAHHQRAGPSSRRTYVTVSDDERDSKRGVRKTVEEDPFADPFAD